MSEVAKTPLRRLLIANRGEIALRVMRSARALGLETVAVYSTADAGAAHVRAADAAVGIGAAAPRESYLNIGSVVAAAKRSGADAVHPGYGFLAENADFAQACRDAGLVFVGPSPEAIRAMGDKAGAKALMLAAGVPCIPGYQGADQSDDRLEAEADKIGWPVMIKATAGGGGRGMRLVRRAADFRAALASARREALAAFGDATVLLERAIDDPRHVEIQVFADRHGHAIHLGERDCSVQRRHQKLIEESPSPAVAADLRERMGAAAVAAARAIGYEGAGTLEFLLDPRGEFFFMEMNTRLQVEHPVTEMRTGIDLVDWQLRVAAGEPLPLRQEELRFHGHAIEVRLCAEDPAHDFVPQSGVLLDWRVPAALRVEHALAPGAEVSAHYDAMIAKLVAFGRDRSEALRRLHHGLGDAVALGIVTNQAFLRRCLEHPVFASGSATTAFVDAQRESLLAIDPATAGEAAALGAVLLRQSDPAADAVRIAPGSRGLRLRWPVPLWLAVDGQPWSGELSADAEGVCRVQLGEQVHTVRLRTIAPGDAGLVFDGVDARVAYRRDRDTLHLHWAGRAWAVRDLARQAAQRGGGEGDGKVRATMAGRVVALGAVLGETVAAGAPLVVLEAMKMEHVHAAPCAGRVVALPVALGDQVEAQRLLAEIAPVERPG
jgi:geranyl-CoA carboxylase alpha subunit